MSTTLLPPLAPDPRWVRSRGRRAAELPFGGAPDGYCRWCGRDLEARLKSGAVDARKRWHPACVAQMRALDQPALRRAVWERELGVCESCGRFCPWDYWACGRLVRAADGRTAWIESRPHGSWPRPELDHVVALRDGGRHEIPNLQLLCDGCHRAKTAREAAARAGHRGASRGAGT